MPGLLLEVQGLETNFKTSEGIAHAVNGISFRLKAGETLGLVGESGCRKTVTMLSVLRMIASPPGRITAGKAFFWAGICSCSTRVCAARVDQVR